MGNLEDFMNFERRLRKELDRLDQHHPDDRPHMKRFVQKLDGHVKDSTLAEYLKNLRVTGDRLDQSITSLSDVDFDDHVYDLRHSPEYGQGDDVGYSDGTVRNIQFVVRKFLQELDLDGTDWADDYELLPPVENNVRPEDMLSPEDINALTSAANNLREVALIEFLADTGARLGLVGSLRVGDVDLDGPAATYTPNPNASGLKGADIRPYPVIDSKAVLRTYLQQIHPRSERDDVALFHKLPGSGNNFEDGDGALSQPSISKQLKSAAEKAGIEKPVNPHNFRHSAITRMRREGYTRSEIEHRVHWTIDTDMWEVYEHISGEEHNQSIFEKAGVVDGDEDSPDRERRPCGNCRELLAPHHEYCPRCGDPMSSRARELKDDAVGAIGDGMVEVDDMSRREFRAMVLRQLQSDASNLGAHEESPSSESSSSSD